MIVAVLVVLGGGVLLFATGGEDGTDPTAGATLTETARGGGSRIALGPENAVGRGLPAAPLVSDEALTGGRRSATAGRERGQDATPAPADAPLVTAALEDDEEIERRPLAVPQEEDIIERAPLAPQTVPETAPQTARESAPQTADVERRKPQARADSAEPSAGAPAEAVADTPAETVAEAPAEVVVEAPAETVAEAPAESVAEAPAEVVAETPAEVVAETPAEAVAEAPAQRRQALAADGDDRDVAEAPAEAGADTPTQRRKALAADGDGRDVAEAPAEAVADTPTQRRQALAADGDGRDVAEAPAEAVAEAPAQRRQALAADGDGRDVAEAPAEAVAEAPTQRRQALVADGDGRDVSVRVIESRRLGAPSRSVADGVLPGFRGIEARTGRRLETAVQFDRTVADAAGPAMIEETRAERTVVAALEPGMPAGRVAPRGAVGVGPTFDVVRISPTGIAVIAGRAEPGADVVVLDRGTALGQVKANRRGEWVLVPIKPLPPGATELYVEAALPGSSPRQSENVVVLSVPQRSVSPAARVGPLAVLTPRGGGATRVLQGSRRPVARDKGGPGVSLDVVDYDDAGNIILSGRADPNAEVRVYTDNRLIGTARSDQAGDWQLRPDVRIAPGDHELRVDSVSVKGKVLARSVLPFSRADLQGLDLRNGRVVVQPGNSLWRIARATYGSGFQFTLIYDANREQIDDPDLIFPGQVFRVPEPN